MPLLVGEGVDVADTEDDPVPLLDTEGEAPLLRLAVADTALAVGLDVGVSVPLPVPLPVELPVPVGV